jgi:hypothetical protein
VLFILLLKTFGISESHDPPAKLGCVRKLLIVKDPVKASGAEEAPR